MNALLNHIPVPFFDRIPPRAKKAHLEAFDSIVDQGRTLEGAYRTFVNALRTLNVDGPQFSEFTDWYWRVRNGHVDRPHPSEIYCASEDGEMPVDPFTPQVKGQNERSLTRSFAIVKAAHGLFEAQLAAGYSPLSIGFDDEIIADALREVLGAAADATVMDADVHMTPGNKVADLLLGESSDHIDTKLFECLTMTMQAELCAILVRQDHRISS